MVKFFKNLGLLTLVCALCIWCAHQWGFRTNVNPWTWGGLVFFFALTSFIYFIGQNALNKSQRTFTNAVYGSMGLRFIFSVFFIVIYLIVNELRDKIFIAEFLLLYLLFTMFEIYHLVAKLRTEK